MPTSNVEDLDRLARNEEKLKAAQEINCLRDIPDFPYSSLDELRTAKESKEITFGAQYDPNLLEALGTRGEIVAHYVWVSFPPLIGIAFIVASFITGKFVLLWGILTVFVGFSLSSPPVKKLASPFIGLAWMACIYFALTNPAWAWIIGGFFGGYIFAATARLQFTMVMEQRALMSEVFFCYLYLSRILVVMDNNQNKLL